MKWPWCCCGCNDDCELCDSLDAQITLTGASLCNGADFNGTFVLPYVGVSTPTGVSKSCAWVQSNSGSAPYVVQHQAAIQNCLTATPDGSPLTFPSGFGTRYIATFIITEFVGDNVSNRDFWQFWVDLSKQAACGTEITLSNFWKFQTSCSPGGGAVCKLKFI